MTEDLSRRCSVGQGLLIRYLSLKVRISRFNTFLLHRRSSISHQFEAHGNSPCSQVETASMSRLSQKPADSGRSALSASIVANTHHVPAALFGSLFARPPACPLTWGSPCEAQSFNTTLRGI